MRLAMMVLAIAAVFGVAYPLISSVAGGGDNEATNLVEASQRTQNKAEDISRTYNDIIPPAPAQVRSTAPRSAPPPATPSTGNSTAPTGNRIPQQETSNLSQRGIPLEPTDPQAVLTHQTTTHQVTTQQATTQQEEADNAEHAVRDAMEFLARVDEELGPTHTEYTMAVEQLKRAWEPKPKPR